MDMSKNKIHIKPISVQRKRTKGWRVPPNTIYVGRGTKFGNVFKIGCKTLNGTIIKDRKMAVEFYKKDIKRYAKDLFYNTVKNELKGKNLMCWCPLSEPCHADILLKIANS